MMTCPKCKKPLLRDAVDWKTLRDDILLCCGCGYSCKSDDWEDGMICAGCGDEVEDAESFCDECLEKFYDDAMG